MSTFALDRHYSQFNFEEISVDELMLVSGGSGSGQCVMGVVGGAMLGGAGAAASIGPGSITPAGWLVIGVAALGGALLAGSAACYS